MIFSKTRYIRMLICIAEVAISLAYNYSSAYHSLTVAPMVWFVYALVLFQLFLNLDRYILQKGHESQKMNCIHHLVQNLHFVTNCIREVFGNIPHLHCSKSKFMDKDKCLRIAFEILFWWVVLVTTET